MPSLKSSQSCPPASSSSSASLWDTTVYRSIKTNAHTSFGLTHSSPSKPGMMSPSPLFSGGFDQPLGLRKAQTTQVVDAPIIVREAPIYTERTSFMTDVLPTVLLRTILLFLTSRPRVRCRSNMKKLTLTCDAYSRFGQVHFVVSIFKRSSQFLVEFQRRCGDHTLFFDLYYATLRHMRKDITGGVEWEEVERREAREETTTQDESHVELSDECLEPLVAMATSKFVDVAREGARVIIGASYFPANQEFLANAVSTPSVLKTLLAHSDPDLVRFGVTLSANLAQCAAAQPLVKEFSPKLQEWASQDDLPEVNHQASEALRMIGVVKPNDLPGDLKQLYIDAGLAAGPYMPSHE